MCCHWIPADCVAFFALLRSLVLVSWHVLYPDMFCILICFMCQTPRGCLLCIGRLGDTAGQIEAGSSAIGYCAGQWGATQAAKQEVCGGWPDVFSELNWTDSMCTHWNILFLFVSLSLVFSLCPAALSIQSVSLWHYNITKAVFLYQALTNPLLVFNSFSDSVSSLICWPPWEDGNYRRVLNWMLRWLANSWHDIWLAVVLFAVLPDS